MDLKSNNAAPVLTDPAAPMNKSRLGMHSRLLPYSPPLTVFPPGFLLAIPRKKTGILDEFRSSIWLDAMKSSSPPPKKITKDVSNEYPSTDADVAYNAWMVFCTPLANVLFFFHFCFIPFWNL